MPGTRKRYVQPCPHCGRRRGWSYTGPAWMCPGCGRELPEAEVRSPLGERLKATLFPQEAPDGLVLVGRALVWVVLVLWGAQFITMDPATNAIGRSFMHHVNIPFHEAGHVLFQPFGRFLHILGGSLFQVLVPLIVAGAFLARLHPFGVAVGLWWAGQSLMDVAPYIYDARRMTLPLIGGGTGRDRPWLHDWHNLLARVDMLAWDYTLAGAARWGGAAIMGLGLAWGAIALWRGWRGRQAGLDSSR